MNADFKINGTILETDRLILRAFKEIDLEDFYEFASVEGVGEMAGWAHLKNKEEAKLLVDNFIEGDKTFAVCLRENKKVIGFLNVKKYGMESALTEFSEYYGRELGAALCKEYWNKGLMTEAVRTVTTYLFNECNLDFIIAGHFDFNVPSKRLQEKCGFKKYRKLTMTTNLGKKVSGTLNLLLNPDKKLELVFSHPETLIYQEDTSTIEEELK